MAVIVIDEDGQSFISPVELDAFTYYRDYILKRLFKEFFQLNPGAAEAGWVDVSGQAWWDIDDDEQGEIVWDGVEILTLARQDFWITAKLRDWPDSPPQKPWTRYLRPTRIRFTVKKSGGGLLTVNCSNFSYDGDGEFMEDFDVGAANLPDGFVFPIDPEARIVGDTDYIWGFKFYYHDGGPDIGDRITKIEFGYDPLNLIDYTNNWVLTDLPGLVSYSHILSTGVRNDGTHAMLLSDGFNDTFHAVWNGESWDFYYLPVADYLAHSNRIGYDDFGNVHYYENGTPGQFIRWSWNLSSGWYDQAIDFRPPQGGGDPDQNWSPSFGRHIATDPDGYNHLIHRARERTPFFYYIGHYYQDASGWHWERIFEIGDNDIENYPWHSGYMEHLDMKIDSYGRVHVFLELSMRDLASIWDLDPFVMYVTNSQGGSWTSQILAPWGLGNQANEGRASINDLYVDRENDNYMTGIVGGRNVPVYFIEKAWAATNWTFTYIAPAGTNWQQSVKIGDIYHFLGDPLGTGSYDIKILNYVKYKGSTHEILESGDYMYLMNNYVGNDINWDHCEYIVRDGKPVLLMNGNASVPHGITEQEISE